MQHMICTLERIMQQPLPGVLNGILMYVSLSTGQMLSLLLLHVLSAWPVQYEGHPSLPHTVSLHIHLATPTVSSWQRHIMVVQQFILKSDLH